MSAPVTSPGPCLRRYIVTGSSCSEETTRSLRFRMTSVTSSLTPSIVENSWSTLTTLMLVTEAPGMDERRVRRSELPRVYPNPGSSGSITNRERNSSTDSSDNVGRWAMSTSEFPFRARPLYEGLERRGPGPRWWRLSSVVVVLTDREAALLLGVVLHDQLLLDRDVD